MTDHPFFEYRAVKAHTVNLDRLRALHLVTLDRPETRDLVRFLSRRFKMKMPDIRHGTRHPSRGVYYHGHEIVVHPTPYAEVVVHEMAHHYVWTHKRYNYNYGRPHGMRFVEALDRLAKAAAVRLGLEER